MTQTFAAAEDAYAVLTTLALGPDGDAFDARRFSLRRTFALARAVATPETQATLLHYLALLDPPPLFLSSAILRAERVLANIERTANNGPRRVPLAKYERRAALVAVWLLQHGARISCRDCRGATPLHMAAATGRRLLCAVILAFSGDPTDVLNASDRDGNTALHYVADAGNTRLFLWITDQWPDVDWARRNVAGQAPAMLLIKNTAQRAFM